jgi:hypothetical protein
MDTARLTEIARSLVDASSRRGFLWTFGAALGFASLRLSGGVYARSKHRKRKKRRKRCKSCGPCQRCRRGTCKPKPDGTACGACRACRTGACVSAPGATCGSGGTCLGNESCAQICDPSQANSCPPGCFCGGNADGPGTCFLNPGAVCDHPQRCSSTAGCPPGESCFIVGCLDASDQRCLPLCPV